jgi:beta-glucosidase
MADTFLFYLLANALADDRTIHELYLWPFADGVRAGAGAVMAAYNAVNGSACTQNSYLINNLLKDELGFQGFIMSDWLAQISGVPSALAGLDMAMPGDTEIPLVFGTSYWMYELSRSVLNGSVPVDRLDDMATRVVAAWYQMGQDQDYPPPNFSSNSDLKEYFLYPGAIPDSPIGVVNQFVDVQADHNMTARQIAQDAVTMLKNDGKVLPLSASTPIVVFGTDAQVNSDGPNACTDRNCDTGTLGMGWGSGTANYPYFDDPISAFKRRTSNVTFYNTDTFPSLSATPTPDDVAFVFLSSDSGEETYNVEGNQGDRSASGLAAWHGGDTLVQQVAEKFQTVVVVVHTVGPLVLEPWINLTSVKAVLFAHLPGQEAGESLTNVLYGDVSPSGHLPYTIPVAESDYPASVSILNAGTGQLQDVYSEGL